MKHTDIPRRSFSALAAHGVLALAGLICAASAHAQVLGSEELAPELTTPPPPSFSTEKLIFLGYRTNSSLRIGVDPDTLSIGKDDIVRYVVVSLKPSGPPSAQYEGIRCRSAETKVYGRFNEDSGWSLVQDPPWRSLFDPVPSRHALLLARGGICASASANTSVRRMIADLRGVENLSLP
ncbi:MAG: CNP1-like family protein [Burkholderiaceae bacterium]